MAQKVEINSTQSLFSVATSCGNCGKTDLKLLQCSRCFFQQYCGKECQKAHWPQHKQVCKVAAPKKEKLWNHIQQQSDRCQKANTDAFSILFPPSVPSGKIAPLLETLFHFQLEQEKVAIDLGCGNGKSTIYLLERGWKVFSIDKDEKSLQLLSNVAQHWIKANKLVVVSGNVEDYSFSVKPHLVVISDVLPYCDAAKVRGIWDKIYNSLEENGYLIGSLFDQAGASIIPWRTCWFVDNIKFVEDLLDASAYRREICRYRPKNNRIERSNIIEFGAKKAGPLN